ncbi:MAG: PAS domain-containing protein [Candidatus Methanoperedens sp.]|nr:PAS domain-containing protein [Candidatus Methanoperedens sp.]
MIINSETDIENLTLKVMDFTESFVDTIHEPFLLVNGDLKIRYANKSFCDNFKVTPEETVGHLIYDIGKREWDIPKLRMLLDDILGFH